MAKFCKDCRSCVKPHYSFARCKHDDFVPVSYYAYKDTDELLSCGKVREDVEACGPSGRNWKPKWWKFWLWFSK